MHNDSTLQITVMISPLTVPSTITNKLKESSALVAYRFHIIFTGYNYFHGNIGGGLELISAYVQTFGTIVFEENSAVVGGGITMNDRCLVSMQRPYMIMLPSISLLIYS